MSELLAILSQLRSLAVEAAPKAVIGLVAAVALVLAAKLVERILRGALTRMRLDHLVAQAGMDQSLKRVGVTQPLAQVLPRLAYYLLLLLFARTAADAFGLRAISDAIASMFGYLPNLIAAALIVVVGSSVSQFVGNAITRSAEESGIEFGKSLGSVAAGLVLFIVIVMAIGQLRFDTEMVRIVTACILAGAALAFGLSIGMGSKDVTRHVLAGFYARKLFRPGDTLEIRGHRGTLRAITATQTLLEQDGHVVAIANSVFLDDTIRQ
jgi:small-conductance mechanosensitive channel